MIQMDLVLTTGDVKIYIPVSISEDDAQAFGSALYAAVAESDISLTLADEAGARIGVTGKFSDSEA